MAQAASRFPQNAPGAFYVDFTCIDCASCRRLAPDQFAAHPDGHAYVSAQPADAAAEDACLRALAACPVDAIGSDGLAPGPAQLRRLLPDLFACGYPDPATDGAESYVIVRPGGNVLVDLPRFEPALVAQLEDLGDLRYVFVTHRDTVGALEAFQLHFGAEVVMHAAEAGEAPLAVAHPFEAPLALAEDLLVLPTPGHSPGSSCLLWRRHGGCLFTGDHLLPVGEQLAPVRFAFTADWGTQREQARMLLDAPWAHAFPARGLAGLPAGFVRKGKPRLAAGLAELA